MLMCKKRESERKKRETIINQLIKKLLITRSHFNQFLAIESRTKLFSFARKIHSFSPLLEIRRITYTQTTMTALMVRDNVQCTLNNVALTALTTTLLYWHWAAPRQQSYLII